MFYSLDAVLVKSISDRLLGLCGRLPRFVAAGVLMAATGILLGYSGVSLQIGFTILYGFLGLVTLLSGSIVFLRFIRQ